MAVIATDQGLLSRRYAPDRLVLAPGDRAEAEWRVGAAEFVVTTAPSTLFGGDLALEEDPVMTVRVAEPAPALAGLAWPFAPEAPTPDPGTTDVVGVFQGSDHTWGSPRRRTRVLRRDDGQALAFDAERGHARVVSLSRCTNPVNI